MAGDAAKNTDAHGGEANTDRQSKFSISKFSISKDGADGVVLLVLPADRSLASVVAVRPVP